MFYGKHLCRRRWIYLTVYAYATNIVLLVTWIIFINQYIYAQIEAFTFSGECYSSLKVRSHDNMECNEPACFYPDFHSFLQNINICTSISITVKICSAFRLEQMLFRLMAYSANELLWSSFLWCSDEKSGRYFSFHTLSDWYTSRICQGRLFTNF